VAGGGLPDIYALLAHFWEKFPTSRPKLILSLDIDGLVGPNPESSVDAEARTDSAGPWSRALAVLQSNGSVLAGLLDPMELAYSLRFMTGDRMEDQTTFTNLGFRAYDHWDQLDQDPKRKTEYEEEKATTRKELLTRLEDSSDLNPVSRLWLQRILELAHQHGSETVIYLPPIQPDFVQEMADVNLQGRKHDILRFLNEINKSHKFKTYDFTDIQSISGDPDGFYDAAHMKTTNINHLMEKLRIVDAI
jgi:hypothetical protein